MLNLFVVDFYGSSYYIHTPCAILLQSAGLLWHRTHQYSICWVFFSVSATLFGAFNYKTSVVSDLVCLFSAFSFLVFVKFRLGFSMIPLSLLCFVVWQVIVECRCAFPVGQLLRSSLLIAAWAWNLFQHHIIRYARGALIWFSSNIMTLDSLRLYC